MGAEIRNIQHYREGGDFLVGGQGQTWVGGGCHFTYM